MTKLKCRCGCAKSCHPTDKKDLCVYRNRCNCVGYIPETRDGGEK